MKSLLFTFLFILLTLSSITSFGQTKIYDEQSDTSFWYGLKKNDAQRIGLVDLKKSSDSLHFRYWMENQAIDIWTSDYITFYGLISNHTDKIDTRSSRMNKRKPDKFYYNKAPIDTLTAKKVYELFEEKGIFKIPSDNKIKGWNQGFDGEEFLIEISTKESYSFKKYWTPSASKNILEAVAVDDVSNELRIMLKLRNSWDDFINKLPVGCYRAGEITMECKFINNVRRK
jgi:hypothetical protein